MPNPPKRRTRTFPGSIYPIKGHLYIKFKGLTKSTGLKDNREGRQYAEQLLKQMWLKYNQLGIYSSERILISKAYEEFKKFKQNRMSKTADTCTNAYNAIVQGDYFLTIKKIEEDILTYLAKKEHSNATINTYLTHIQTFLNYCTRQKWIEQTYFKKDFKKKETITPQIWTDEELGALLHYFADANPDIKDIIELSLYTGAMISDCVNLRKSDIDFKANPVTVVWLNKIDKEKEKRPVIKYVANILARRCKSDPDVFPWTYNSRTFINKAIKKACETLEINQNRRSFQEFRVTFSNNLLKNHVEKVIVQYLMRHREGETIDKYYTTEQKVELIEHVETLFNDLVELRKPLKM